MTKPRPNPLRALGLLAVTFTPAITALAQTDDQRSGPVIEEVVVVAQKRAQRNVDVGISVAALSGDSMKERRMTQIKHIAAHVPNVNIKEQVPGAIPVVTIRGIGLEDFSTTNSPAAGIYVDEVPLSSLALMSVEFYDMEGVEVLKGPQGTLYGRNSTAGALNMVTAKPSQEWEFSIAGGIANFEYQEASGMVNIPLWDSAAIRISGKRVRQDEGYWRSRFGANEEATPAGLPGMAQLPGLPLSEGSDTRAVKRDIGERDTDLGRVLLRWDALDTVSLLLKADFLNEDSELGQPEFFGLSCAGDAEPIDQENCTDLNGYRDNDGDPYEGDWNQDFPHLIDRSSYLLTANIDIGEMLLTSVTGYMDLDRLFVIDVDATPREHFDFTQDDAVKQRTQELRLSGGWGINDWQLGFFWSRDEATVLIDGRHEELIPGESSQTTADQTTRSRATFVNFEWHLSEPLTLITGARYTEEERRYTGGTDWAIEVDGTINDTFVEDAIGDSNWVWKLGLNYSVTKDSLLYVSAAKGTKSGGFFAGTTTANDQLVPYEPEELVSYELGYKRQGRLTLNTALFYYDYKGVQTFMRAQTAPVQLIGNVDQATVFGADLDFVWLAFEGMTVEGGVGYLDTELSSFTGPDGADVPEGNELPNAPRLSANLLLRYEHGLLDTGWMLSYQINGTYSDEHFKQATNDPLIASDSYTVVDARLSLLSENRSWDVSLWGRNLTDEQYVVQGLNLGAFFVGHRHFNAPKTYGLEFSWRY